MVIDERGHGAHDVSVARHLSTNTALWSACGQCCTNDVDEHSLLRRGERDNQPPIAAIPLRSRKRLENPSLDRRIAERRSNDSGRQLSAAPGPRPDGCGPRRSWTLTPQAQSRAV